MRKKRNIANRPTNAMFTWSSLLEIMASLSERSPVTSDEHKERSFAFIQDAFNHAVKTFIRTKATLTISILEASSLLIQCLRNNRKVMVCGSGGSGATESQHFADELVGRFESPNRKSLPALALTVDSSNHTAWANDMGYDDGFAKQVEVFGQAGDVLFCFSTSNLTPNIIWAQKAAQEKQMFCIAFTGEDNGEVSLYADVNIVIPPGHTEHNHELHLHVLHAMCSLIEAGLFEKKEKPSALNGHLRQPINGNDRTKYMNGKHM